MACRHARGDLAQALLDASEPDADLQLSAGAALVDAARSGDAAIVRVLVRSGKVDTNARDTDAGDSALHLAARAGHADVVRLLVGPARPVGDAPGNRSGWTALMCACERGHLPVVQTLVAAASADYLNHKAAGRSDAEGRWHEGTTALLEAIANQHEGCALALIGAGAAIDVGLSGGAFDRTPLIAACVSGCGQPRVARALLERGADVNGSNSFGCLALRTAATLHRAEIVRQLLAAGGVDVNRANSAGTTALHCAVPAAGDDDGGGGATRVIEQLLGAEGIRASPANHGGKTPLHLAAAGQHPNATALLLRGGACRFAKDCRGCAPHEYAAAKAVRAVFAAGVDYWRPSEHGGHSLQMQRVMRALVLARLRLARAGAAPAGRRAERGCGARAPSPVTAPPPVALAHLPLEVWLIVWGFLRSADFPAL